MNRRFLYDTLPSADNPVFGLAPQGHGGFRLRMDGREVGPLINTKGAAQYLVEWMEFAWEDLHRG